MNAINKALQNIDAGERQEFKNLTITPLIRKSPFAVDYLTLDEALKTEGLTITETSESGNVPELLLENNGDTSVLLLDSEELVGAKQNRILNLTILVAAHSKLNIPVSCANRLVR